MQVPSRAPSYEQKNDKHNHYLACDIEILGAQWPTLLKPWELFGKWPREHCLDDWNLFNFSRINLIWPNSLKRMSEVEKSKGSEIKTQQEQIKQNTH